MDIKTEAEQAARAYLANNQSLTNGSYEQYEAGAGYREGYEAGASKYEAEITRLRTALERIKFIQENVVGGEHSTTNRIASNALQITL